MSERFKFNDCGVCVNPDKETIGNGMTSLEITTAVVRGKWTWGIRYMLSDRGGSFGCNLSNKDWTNTQEESLQHALEWAKEWLVKQMADKSVAKKAKQLLNSVEKLMPSRKQPIQLELFNF